jgi:hypothetical protein
MPRIPNPTIGLLTQTPTQGDPHVWDAYIETTFKQALCTPSSTITYSTQIGHDPASYLAGAQILMRGDPGPPIVPAADVIVTAGKVAAKACYDATNTVPPPTKVPAVVVASAGDLSGLTGGNLTGCTNGQFDPQIVQGRVNWMQGQLNPNEVGVVGNYTSLKAAMDDVVTALGAIRPPGHPLVGHIIDVNPTNFQTAQDLQRILANKKQQHPNINVLYVCSDPFLRTNGNVLVDVARNHPLGRFLTMHEFGEWVSYHHGDRAYGPDFKKLFQRAAGYVDQILNGALPANLPVFAPTLVDCV